MQQTVELLTMFLEHKHNGFITRGVDHPDVRNQVVRCIKTANKQDAQSKEEFCIVRQKRQRGRYRRNIMIEGLLMHAGMGSEALPQSLSSFDYKCRNKDCPLPPEIESKIAQIITIERMRKSDGEYPLLRLGRRFFNALWDGRGSARIPRDMWHAMLGYEDPSEALPQTNFRVATGI